MSAMLPPQPQPRPDREALRADFPYTVPDRVLWDRRTLEALDRRDFGELLAMAHRRGPTTQAVLGFAIGVGTGRVGDYIAGRYRPRRREILERIADGLGIPGHMMGLPTRPWEAGQPRVKPTRRQDDEPGEFHRTAFILWTPEALAQPTTAAGTVERLSVLMDGPMERRDFVAVSGAAVIVPGHQWLLDSARLATVRDSGRPVDAETMDGIDRIINEQRAFSDRVGIDAALPALRGQLVSIVHVIKHNSYTETVGARLYGAASELARLIGWLHLEDGDPSTARRYFVTALQASRLANDPQLGAYTLGLMSSVESRYGDPRHAIVLLQTAQAGAAGQLTHRHAALLHAKLARAHGKLGDVRTIDRHVGDSAELNYASANEPQPPYLHWVDEGELSGLHGKAFLLVGNYQQALSSLKASTAHVGAQLPRDRAVCDAELATTHLALGEVEQACASASHAADVAESLGGARISAAVTGFAHKLIPYRDNAAAAAFIDRARGLPTV